MPHSAKLIMVFGTFDLLHPGHLFVLEEAGKRGRVTVIVARDSSVRRMKKLEPTETQEERVAAIAKRFPTMHVRLGDPTDFLAPVRETPPDLILLGYDQKLPPGVTEKDLGCAIERLPAFKPEEYKSSLKRKASRLTP